MDKDFERVIFSYLDSQDFIQIKKNNFIYFVNSEGDEYAQIRYNEDSEVCFISIDLIKEISSLFSLQRSDSKEVIGMWVENTLQMKVNYTMKVKWWDVKIVENTLQMRVTHTHDLFAQYAPPLRIPSN